MINIFKDIYARIFLKKDTEDNWNANNPVIGDGEMIIVVTASNIMKTKIGNGTSRYSELPFHGEENKTHWVDIK